MTRATKHLSKFKTVRYPTVLNSVLKVPIGPTETSITSTTSKDDPGPHDADPGDDIRKSSIHRRTSYIPAVSTMA
jgi:hypothetical protein